MNEPRCIGFGIHEGRCHDVADTPAMLWCQRCEKLRRETISRQIAAIASSFKEAK